MSHRIIRTIYPPIDIFEDIADPADWELLVAAEAKLNPRIRDQVGNLALVPVARRVAGPTASIVMGAFTHVSRDRPGRFSDGSYGVWSCGDRFEVALAETAHHFERFMRATNEPAGEADYRELVAAVQGRVADGADPALLAPDDWRPGQAFGKQVREGGGDGVLYPSVRYPAGKALALFWPDCITLPVTQARQFRYSWDGARMHRYLVHGTREWVAYP
ncbi:RES family NAD+ phosphorylase [Elioraea tepidiphila]|uniref:RES family NAD+ phosphorylase n=1 Tax=Elioraea tepidiphila TaxID=457934 RepID=UPI00036F8882|nr:RES family NAD+ phosphorylase [Elioraea tepidiphila]